MTASRARLSGPINPQTSEIRFTPRPRARVPAASVHQLHDVPCCGKQQKTDPISPVVGIVEPADINTLKHSMVELFEYDLPTLHVSQLVRVRTMYASRADAKKKKMGVIKNLPNKSFKV